MAFSADQLLDKVNTYLADMNYVREPKGLYAPIKYVLSLGGKRIRPVLMLLSYQLYRDNVDAILSQAAGIEIYHNYTLLHDDLMDRADMRRNKPTVHKVWDDNTAILSGDAMLVLAYRLMGDCSAGCLKQVMDIFDQTALEICEGQQWDMEFEGRNDVTVSEYIEMIRLKTSVLLSAALKIGAVLGGAPEDDAQKLYDFGIRMGLAFQLQDDLLDVYGDSNVFGKNIGGDILCNKKTFMLINALALADKRQQNELTKWMACANFRPEEKIKAVTAIYNEIGIGEICEDKINAYYAEGLSLLESLNISSDKKEELKHFVCGLMNRKL
ncbi:polyprenyl synthetase family protein [Phocaeicola sp.]|uniref:polyprenyl synthetase family protein n=1 Tax=Phocaeicola sp. TaxID=2773926 RepID=UPI0023C97DF7|nr:polyprenyl synthetase family protein [Phocaeicola sp.]MDE5677799.1 polyprenyl synthetase family protein [Phocaeicola sp.]